jgi:hypothetical protein
VPAHADHDRGALVLDEFQTQAAKQLALGVGTAATVTAAMRTARAGAARPRRQRRQVLTPGDDVSVAPRALRHGALVVRDTGPGISRKPVAPLRALPRGREARPTAGLASRSLAS